MHNWGNQTIWANVSLVSLWSKFLMSYELTNRRFRNDGRERERKFVCKTFYVCSAHVCPLSSIVRVHLYTTYLCTFERREYVVGSWMPYFCNLSVFILFTQGIVYILFVFTFLLWSIDQAKAEGSRKSRSHNPSSYIILQRVWRHWYIFQ